MNLSKKLLIEPLTQRPHAFRSPDRGGEGYEVVLNGAEALCQQDIKDSEALKLEDL